MSSSSIKLAPVRVPPARRLFVPSPGYVLFEADLSRADAQVVAKESNDLALLLDFKNKVDIYTANAEELYKNRPITQEQYQWNKNAVHAMDYVVQANTLAKTLHVTKEEAQRAIDSWFRKHPGIRAWHNKVKAQLQRTRSVHNIYGFRKVYTARLDHILPQATAWIASSTVSVTINRAMLALYNALPEVRILMQIHDSILGEVRIQDTPGIFNAILNLTQIPIPYPDPLVIPMALKVSEKSWGDVKGYKPI